MGKPVRPEWRVVEAKFRSQRNHRIELVVLHDTFGSGTHQDTLYLANPQDGRQVSVDFTVERDGSIWKLNADLAQFSCWHAGRATAWRDLTNAEINHASIGIEIVQCSTLELRPMYPAAQVEAVARLTAWLVSEFSLDASRIVCHRDIITDGSRTDPRNFPFEGDGGFWDHFRRAHRGEVPCPGTTL